MVFGYDGLCPRSITRNSAVAARRFPLAALRHNAGLPFHRRSDGLKPSRRVQLPSLEVFEERLAEDAAPPLQWRQPLRD